MTIAGEQETGPQQLARLLRGAIQQAAKLKAQHQRIMAQADRMVLCGPDCQWPGRRSGLEHAHTYGDMLRMASGAEYHWELRKAQDERDLGSGVDVGRVLRAHGVGELHVIGLDRLESWPMLRAARQWLNQKRVPVGGDGMRSLAQVAGGTTPTRLERPTLTLLGKPGTGKSQTAAWIVKSHALRNWRAHQQQQQRAILEGWQPAPFAMWTRVGSLLAMPLRDGDPHHRLGAWEQEASGARLLVLDELGADDLPPSVAKAVQDVLDARYRAAKPTICTSNATLAVLEARLDGPVPEGSEGRAGRRLREGWVVEQRGKEVRTQAGGREVR